MSVEVGDLKVIVGRFEMRSWTRLLTVLVATLLFVTPLTFASAQSGNDGYNGYDYFSGVPSDPVALPATGANSATGGDAPYLGIVSGSAGILSTPASSGADSVTSGYVPYLGLVGDSAGLPVVLPQTGANVGFLDGIPLYDMTVGGLATAPSGVPNGFVWPDDVPYVYGDLSGASVASAPTTLPVTGFIWPDDIPYAFGDTLTFNDSGASGMPVAPSNLPQTGADSLGVVGGR
jgi:hypothetical protein